MASNESEMDDSACRTARRAARDKMLEICGTRQQKADATARDMGLIGEGGTFDPDADALLGGEVAAADAGRAALAAVWFDNPETGEPLIDQHDGDFAAAMAEGWTVVDDLNLSDSEEALEDAADDADAEQGPPIPDDEGEGEGDSDDADAPTPEEIEAEEDFVPLDDGDEADGPDEAPDAGDGEDDDADVDADAGAAGGDAPDGEAEDAAEADAADGDE